MNGETEVKYNPVLYQSSNVLFYMKNVGKFTMYLSVKLFYFTLCGVSVVLYTPCRVLKIIKIP